MDDRPDLMPQLAWGKFMVAATSTAEPRNPRSSKDMSPFFSSIAILGEFLKLLSASDLSVGSLNPEIYWTTNTSKYINDHARKGNPRRLRVEGYY